MKKYLFILFLLCLCGVAYAQSTSAHVVLGFETTSGCPGGAYVCWVPYTAINPMPVGSY